MIAGWPDPPEDPLTGLIRIIEVVRDIQQAYPDFRVIGSGYSWLRQYLAPVAAGLVRDGWTALVGVGRGALAYPDFARDILRTGRMDPHKVCVACSSCTQIMRDGGMSGCVVRDPEIYAPIFKAGRMKDAATLRKLASQCRQCPDAMCTANCPAGVDIPGFLGALADGQEEQAYRILRAGNVLAGNLRVRLPGRGPVPGRLHPPLPRRGPGADRRNPAVPFRAGRRGRVGEDRRPRRVHRPSMWRSSARARPGYPRPPSCFGSGHRVTVFEARQRVGGKIDGVIPASRISAERAEAEIEALFDVRPGRAVRVAARRGARPGPHAGRRAGEAGSTRPCSPWDSARG